MSTVSPRVIICEDDFLLAEALADAVLQLGCEVEICVNNVEGALQAAATLNSHLAIVDLDLRGIKVYEVLDSLRQRGIPYILATSAAEHDIPPRFSHAPRVIKPYALATLRQAMKQIGIIE